LEEILNNVESLEGLNPVPPPHSPSSGKEDAAAEGSQRIDETYETKKQLEKDFAADMVSVERAAAHSERSLKQKALKAEAEAVEKIAVEMMVEVEKEGKAIRAMEPGNHNKLRSTVLKVATSKAHAKRREADALWESYDRSLWGKDSEAPSGGQVSGPPAPLKDEDKKSMAERLLGEAEEGEAAAAKLEEEKESLQRMLAALEEKLEGNDRKVGALRRIAKDKRREAYELKEELVTRTPPMPSRKPELDLATGTLTDNLADLYEKRLPPIGYKSPSNVVELREGSPDRVLANIPTIERRGSRS
jgi:hypothetical protein